MRILLIDIFSVLDGMTGKQPFDKVARSGNQVSNHAKCHQEFKKCATLSELYDLLSRAQV